MGQLAIEPGEEDLTNNPKISSIAIPDLPMEGTNKEARTMDMTGLLAIEASIAETPGLPMRGVDEEGEKSTMSRMDMLAIEPGQEPPNKKSKMSSAIQIPGLPLGAVNETVKRCAMTAEERREFREALNTIETAAPPVNKRKRKRVVVPYQHEYMVDRIMAQHGKRFLVSWSGWNFTYCSSCSMADLQNSPMLMRNFVEYQKGVDAIYKNVINTTWYRENGIKSSRSKNLFKRRFVHPLKSIGDDKLKPLLAGPKKELTKTLGPLKYWKIKRIELDWLKALNPKLDFRYPPLYLESMTSDCKAPSIEFILNYTTSDKVQEFFHTKGSHNCVFNSPEKFCALCKKRNLVKLVQHDPDNVCNVTFPKSMKEGSAHITYYMVVCTFGNCMCPNGWKKCQTWLPHYPREVPLVVFADPRYNGWGVRALTDIPKGRIISEYLGHVSLESELEEGDYSYQMATKTSDIVIDCKFMGSESRFFGHTCVNANLGLVVVFVRGSPMEHQFRHCFVTLRDIKAGEDLTFDYHPGDMKPQKGYGKCQCGTAQCRKWL